VRGHSATALGSLRELGADAIDERALESLASLYDGAAGEPLSLETELRAAGRDAVLVSRELGLLGKSDRDTRFPDTTLGNQLADAVALLERRTELGVEVITLDHGGWDTHFLQGASLAANAADLAKSLAAFREALGDGFRDTTVVVLTEFGRRCRERLARHHHGRGSVAPSRAAVSRGGVFGPAPSLPRMRSRMGDLRAHRLPPDPRDDRTLLKNPRVADVLPGLATSRASVVHPR
jgi:uncharacterized protein (DUF1501 family)